MPSNTIKLLVNTDIIIDLLCKKEPFYLQCLELIQWADRQKCKLFVSAYSLSEIIKTLEKHLVPDKVQEAVLNLASIFEIYGVTQADVKNGLSISGMPVEAVILISTAKRIKVPYVISNRYDTLNTQHMGVNFLSVSDFFQIIT